MNLLKITKTRAINEINSRIGTEKTGAKIMQAKIENHYFLISNLHVGAANILKQDALSIGAELAVPAGTIVCETKTVDCVLIANEKQLKILVKKELAQPFGLKELAISLKAHLVNSDPQKAKVMGIVNVNEDSFYHKSRVDSTNAPDTFLRMIDEGADIIDVGAVSSRPGSEMVDESTELSRLSGVFAYVKQTKLYEKIELSIDTYSPIVAQHALDVGFSYINDISGLSDEKLATTIAPYHPHYIIMHMQGVPKTMQEKPYYENLFEEIDHFFANKIALAHSLGVQNTILDVGIGFGKTLQHNLSLLQNMGHFLHHQSPILVGLSRKSFINTLSPSSEANRLGATLALNMDAIAKGASIIRVHDVYEHRQAIDLVYAMNNL